MQSHGPKRVYTPKSLEFWFSRLEADWEGQFDGEAVEKGPRRRELLDVAKARTVLRLAAQVPGVRRARRK